MRAVIFICIFAIGQVSAENEAVEDINGEVIKIDVGKKKSCNCDKKKSDTKKAQEHEYAENASKALSSSFLNSDKNKDFIDECFPRIQQKSPSIEEIYKL